MNSKILHSAVAFAILLGGSLSAWAALGNLAPARVKTVAVHSTSLGNKSWIELETTTSLPNCPIIGGKVLFVVADDARGDKMLAIANAALLSRKMVTAFADGALPKVEGVCELRALYLNQ